MDDHRVSINRVVSFLVLVVVGGLSQLFLVAFLRALSGEATDLAVLLKDGGLYFFATSLLASSFFSLADKGEMSTGSPDFVITILIVPIVALMSVSAYSQGFERSLPPPVGSASPHLVATQLCCATGSVIYAIYAAYSTGLFWAKAGKPNQQNA